MMFGGPPMMMQQQPQFAQQPMQRAPVQPKGQVAGIQPWPPTKAQPKPQAQPVLAQGPKQPIVARGKPYEEDFQLPPPPPMAPVEVAPVRMPSPEDLGLTPRSTAQIDWNAAHERFQRMGGVGMNVAQTQDGRVRVALVLKTNQVDEVHHVEAVAATEAEAVNGALANAEEWAGSRLH